jgi:hypothetical protein
MSGPADPADQLEALRQTLAAGNTDLYRHLALYLQVLREVLPGRVQQACFHLATQIHPERYARLPAEPRRHFHRRLVLLVERCLSLLTVEQLASLARQIAVERPRRRSRRGVPPPSPELRSGAGRDTGAGDAGEAGDLPEGSVRLGLDPPLSAGWLNTLPSLPAEPGPPSPFLPGPGEEAETEEEGDEEGGEAAGADALLPDPWHEGCLPRDPVTLLRWLDGVEAALTRRLRNLSHALNVEVLRAGLSDGLLPVTLLDAVLDGQLEPQAAPPNLLRLQLPFPAPAGAGPFQTVAVLLRPADLELEEPRLRTCRRRWQQHRLEVRRMARQFRLLQRRLQAREAERLWLQDIRTTASGSG